MALDRLRCPLYSTHMLQLHPDTNWRLLEPTPKAALALARKLMLPAWAAQVLCHRGLADLDEARSYLESNLMGLPSPRGLKGLDEALEVLVPAVRQGQVIGVAGDYDADGVTSTALMVDFLRNSGVQVVWDLPHRMEDGYGFSPAAATRLAEAGAQVVVTVDCGTSDLEGVDKALELGLKVVVTDHHQIPPGELPKAHALINPQQDGCEHSCYLAGVGVAFYVAAGLRAKLKEAGYYDHIPMPNLRHSLDLVALGTMADVVPLKDCNRILVREGVETLNQMRRPGIKALSLVARQHPPLDARDLAFGLAPRINAAGRMDSPDDALRLLLADNEKDAMHLAYRLDELNRRRREVEGQVFKDAISDLEANPALGDRALVCLSSPDWHRGVLGIVASRLVERIRRPVMLFAIENGKAYGSGRSLPGLHLQKALSECAHHLLTYGGHALAAGASAKSEVLNDLAQALDQAARDQNEGELSIPPLTLEVQTNLAELKAGGLEALTRLAPFGQDNPEPMVLVPGVRVVKSSVVGDNHLKLELNHGGARMSGIGFGLGQQIPEPDSRVDLAAYPRISNFYGRQVELVLKDLRPAG